MIRAPGSYVTHPQIPLLRKGHAGACPFSLPGVPTGTPFFHTPEMRLTVRRISSPRQTGCYFTFLLTDFTTHRHPTIINNMAGISRRTLLSSPNAHQIISTPDRILSIPLKKNIDCTSLANTVCHSERSIQYLSTFTLSSGS